MPIFRLVTREYRFRAVDSIFFPPGKAGNVFRGALGMLLPPETGAGSRAGIRPGGQPGGMKDPPRPFVLRAGHLDGVLLEPAREFALSVHFFDLRGALIQAFDEAMKALEHTGLGPRRGRVMHLGTGPATEVGIDLSAGTPVSGLTVNFVTPTELKGLEDRPTVIPFGVLFARVRDRLSSLASLYAEGLGCGEGMGAVDYTGMGRRAASVRTVACEVQYREIVRLSSRTGQSHGIGGFTGRARYEGEMAEFLPYLKAAWWTGVGRHTVWGNGVLSCE